MKTYRIELPANFLQVAIDGLNELPRRISQPVIEVIQQQVLAQSSRESPTPKTAPALPTQG